MEYGICMLATVSVREMPSGKSQMVNQLLFGELFMVKAKKEKWFLIETVDDHYEGWVYQIQVKIVNEDFFHQANKSASHYLHMLCGQVRLDKIIIPVSRGAQFHLWDDGFFTIEDQQYYYKKAIHPAPNKPSNKDIIDVAKDYLEVPYLWGGRSPFGIDGSGLIQVVFKMNGILLPRDATQQVNNGEQILFVEAAERRDLAFFENKEGNINHVGIILGDGKILHSWGKVRIDSIDHQGVFNKEAGRYTHHLRVVKRIISG